LANWTISAVREDFDEIANEFAISPITARLLVNRNIRSQEEITSYLNGTLADLADPFLLKGLTDAVKILEGKIAANAKIRIIGDYDADGICATAILFKGLTTLGVQVDTVIPDRIKDGYGINIDLINNAAAAGIDTIITCDNGIAAVAEIALARQLGLTVIVTDHHEPPDELPTACAIIDPHQTDCLYPFKAICGATVALRLIEGLFCHLKTPLSPILYDELVLLAAIATVCDVMELCGENRILVKHCLKELGKCQNIGLKALINATGIGDKKLTAYHIGFVIGPAINATGRIDCANRSLSLLLTSDNDEAVQIAASLVAINEERKLMTSQRVTEAMQIVEAMELDKVIVIYLPDCHESLAGIIAGRIREHYHRPIFVLTDSEDGVKGSGRGMDAYHMFDELSRVKNLFIKFGGHKLAAGLTMAKENVETFRHLINENAVLTADDFVEKVKIDIALPFGFATLDLVKEFALLEPFGVGNRKPLFAQKGVTFLAGQEMGTSGRAARYTVADSDGHRHELVYFGDIATFNAYLDEAFSPELRKNLYQKDIATRNNRSGSDTIIEKNNVYQSIILNVTYQPEINHYKERVRVQLIMQHYC
jgi:single-stranded-DNA-specific exonuclease